MILKAIFGTKHDRDIRKIRPLVQNINAREEELKHFSDEQLKNQTPKLKEQYRRGMPLRELIPEAFATVREASRRTLKMRHFDVQLVGALSSSMVKFLR